MRISPCQGRSEAVWNALDECGGLLASGRAVKEGLTWLAARLYDFEEASKRVAS